MTFWNQSRVNPHIQYIQVYIQVFRYIFSVFGIFKYIQYILRKPLDSLNHGAHQPLPLFGADFDLLDPCPQGRWSHGMTCKVQRQRQPAWHTNTRAQRQRHQRQRKPAWHTNTRALLWLNPKPFRNPTSLFRSSIITGEFPPLQQEIKELHQQSA